MRDALDVGCGTGVLLERIALERPEEGSVGVDLSPGMLARARDRLGARAALVAGSALRLPFRGATFDLVVSASALHHMPDPPLAVAEMRRVLRPGGRVAITDWCADGWLVRLRDRVLRRRDPGYARALRAAELASLLAQAGFSDVRVDRWRIGFRWGLMTGSANVPLGS